MSWFAAIWIYRNFPGHAGEPLYAIGMMCTELGMPLERPDNTDKRVNAISDPTGHFISALYSEERKIMTDVSHVPSLTLSKIRILPRRWPDLLGYGCPLWKRDSVRIPGGDHFKSTDSGRNISDHIVTDSLRASSPSIIRHWAFQNLILKYATSSIESPSMSSGPNPFVSHLSDMVGRSNRFHDAAARAEVTEHAPLNQGNGESSMGIWSPRSDPEAEAMPTQQRMLSVFLSPLSIRRRRPRM